MASSEGIDIKIEKDPRDNKAVGANENYYGVCDVVDPEKARAMAEQLRAERKNPNRKVMVGVMTHPLALHPEINIPGVDLDAVRKCFPTRETMANGFIDDPDVFNTVHYADLYGPRKGQNLLPNLELVVEYGGENLHAIQVDVTWPNIAEMQEFKSKHPELMIILQLGKFAFAEAENDPKKVVEKLKGYGDSIDFALLDMSMGKGTPMESQGLLPLLRLIKREMPGLGLAVAGGLGPESMHLLEPIAEEFPGISFDAQGLLKPLDAERDEKGHMLSTIPADAGRSREYISKACKMMDNFPAKV